MKYVLGANRFCVELLKSTLDVQVGRKVKYSKCVICWVIYEQMAAYECRICRKRDNISSSVSVCSPSGIDPITFAGALVATCTSTVRVEGNNPGIHRLATIRLSQAPILNKAFLEVLNC